MKLLRRADHRASARRLAEGAAVTAAVYFAAPLSAWITGAGLPIWLTTSVAMTLLRTLGARHWPAVLFAGGLAAIATGHSPLTAATLALSGLLEALVGFWLIGLRERFCKVLGVWRPCFARS